MRLARVLVLLMGLALAGTGTALAFGRTGHLIAGEIAAPLLCARARWAVATLGGGESLGELGVWADEIRNLPAWEHSAPWHYMNIADGEPLTSYRPPEQGDVLWAIEHFTARLGDEALAPASRARALRFLAHFVVDIHQPLHVGRPSDRGGNAITIDVDGEPTSLHRLWDSAVVARGARDGQRAAVAAAALAAANGDAWAATTARDWAAESLRLRAFVYSFDDIPRESYLGEARAISHRRLAQAGVRLAATLNGIFCERPAMRVR